MEPCKVSTRKEGTVFRQKLQAILDKPFDMVELAEMWEEINHKKPVTRRRETRKRSLDVATNEEGFSYLDQNPDLADKLISAVSPETKLQLLRGFFCWLQYACVAGSFKPWVDQNPATSDEDCLVTEGPDRKIVVVDLSEDEDEDEDEQEHKHEHEHEDEDEIVYLSTQRSLPRVSQTQEHFTKEYENAQLCLNQNMIHSCKFHSVINKGSVLYQNLVSAQVCVIEDESTTMLQCPQVILIDDDDETPRLDPNITFTTLLEEVESHSSNSNLSLIQFFVDDPA